jgi:RNA-directed DNA polymerase
MINLVEQISQETGLRGVDVRRIMMRAPVMYKTFFIPKRTGGLREISQPTREVKYVQRALRSVLLDGLPVHERATAYRVGQSILSNALPHAGDGPILKIDLKDFFHSIKARDWVSYCQEKEIGLSDEEIELTSRLLFHKRPGARILSLAIGAPTSPSISNILMYDFDVKIVDNLENDKVIYTRYADDMTFSAPRTGYLNGVLTTVSAALRSISYPRLSINKKKTTHVTRKYGRSVTGLTLANDGRVTIGWENKRKLHAAVHQAKLNRFDQEKLQIVAGMLAYVNSVEPEFVDVLRKKYGADIILAIQKTVVKKQKPEDHVPPLARIRSTESEPQIES